MAEETPRNEQQTSTKVGVDLTSLTDLDLGPRWSSGSVLENTPRLNFREERDRGPRQSRSSGPRRDRRPPRSEGAPRPEGSASSDPRASRGNRSPRRDYSRPTPPPPFMPIVQVALYPEDGPFKLLGNAIKNSGRTYELFEIARLILEKAERFVVVVHPLPDAQPQALFVSLPDNMPFESEEAALNHVFTSNVANFLEVEEVQVDPPKGNFQLVNRCGITGELLAPPNYHKYQQILQAHYAERCSNMSYDRFLSSIEGVREKEAIDQWIEKMRKQTHYKLKEPIEGSPVEYDSLESARFTLVTHAKDKLVRVVQNARFEGRVVEQMPAGPIRKSIETIVEQQRRFPLDTANNLRGRLRRMGFSVYKKGSKGISYVCSIRRNFRKVGEVFSETIQQLIEFVEAHPGFPASDLPKEYLGAEIPAEGGEAAMEPQDLERLKQLRTDLRWLITSGYVTEYSNGKLFAPPPQANQAPAVEEDTAGESAEAASSSEAAAPTVEIAAPEDATDASLATGAPVALADALNVPEVIPEAPAVDLPPVTEVTPEVTAAEPQATAVETPAATQEATIAEPSSSEVKPVS